jgi:uncharacterized membrane protein
MPRAHRTISWITVAVLAFIGRFNYGWWFWAAVILVMNIITYRHEQAPEYPLLPASRWLMGLLALILLALTFTVSPLQIIQK